MGSGLGAGRLTAALAVREAAEALGSGAGGRAGADAVLAGLFSLVTPCAAAVERWDPVLGRHETVVSAGYADEALAALETSFHQDPRFPLVRAGGRPLRVSDIDPAQRSGAIFDQVILPARFTDGVSLCLESAGRYVGSVHASTTSSDVDDECVALLRLLSADLAALVDPLAGAVVVPSSADAGVLAWSPDDGRALALTASAQPALVAAGSPLAALLAPSRWPARLGRSLLVLAGAEVLAVEARPAGAWVVVEHRAVAPPSGLSLRELEVLVLLASGATNRMAARSLGITERTVATHVEHVLVKLGAGNRAGAAAFAAEVGLVRVPHPGGSQVRCVVNQRSWAGAETAKASPT